MAVISAKGCTFTFNSQTIGGIKSFSISGEEVTEKDRTTLASTAMEYAPGLPDSGTLTLSGFIDQDDAGVAAVLAAYTAGTTHTVVVTLPSSTLNVITCSGFVKSPGGNISGEVNGDINGDIVIRYTGAKAYS